MLYSDTVLTFLSSWVSKLEVNSSLTLPFAYYINQCFVASCKMFGCMILGKWKEIFLSKVKLPW